MAPSLFPSHDRSGYPKVEGMRVPNIRIKDLRVASLAAAALPTYTSVDTQQPFLSALEVSRNKLGAINGMFSFDLFKFIEINSSLSGILKNDASLINSVEVKEINIWRKQSDIPAPGNSLTPVPKASCGIAKKSKFKRVATLDQGCVVLDTPNNNGDKILDISYVDAERETLSVPSA